MVVRPEIQLAFQASWGVRMRPQVTSPVRSSTSAVASRTASPSFNHCGTSCEVLRDDGVCELVPHDGSSLPAVLVADDERRAHVGAIRVDARQLVSHRAQLAGADDDDLERLARRPGVGQERRRHRAPRVLELANERRREARAEIGLDEEVLARGADPLLAALVARARRRGARGAEEQEQDEDARGGCHGIRVRAPTPPARALDRAACPPRPGARSAVGRSSAA